MDINSEDLARLAALAERCAAEGQMNLNKLLEAAIYASSRRQGWQYRPAVTKESLLAELDECLAALEQDGTSAELLGILKLGRELQAQARPGDMLIEEAPDAFVCRTCGHTVFEAPPQQCPECGAYPGRFRKFVSIFNGDNYDPLNPADVFASLRDNAAALERLVQDLSEAEMSRPPAPGEWSIGEHLAHFFDVQVMLDGRLELMLAQDDPQLAGLAAYDLAAQADQHPATAGATLQGFLHKRSECLRRLEGLPYKDLWRTGQHAEFGRITLLRQLVYVANHEQTHLPEVAGLRKLVRG